MIEATKPTDEQKLALLVDAVRGAIAIVDRLDAREFFKRLYAKDPFAMAAYQATADHLGPALHMLGIKVPPMWSGDQSPVSIDEALSRTRVELKSRTKSRTAGYPGAKALRDR